MQNANETTKSLGSLGKLTKANLIDIILRKDNVEKKLNNEIEQLNQELDDIHTKNNKLNIDIANTRVELARANQITEEFKESFDENASELQETKNNLLFWKSIAIFVSLILILCVIGKIIFSL